MISLSLLVVQLSILTACLIAAAHCSFLLTLFTGTCSPLAIELLPSLGGHSLWYAQGLGFHLRKILSNFTRVLSANVSSLPRSSWRLSFPFKVLASLLSVASLANFDRIHSIPFFHITCEAIEQCCAQYRSLGDPNCGKLPFGKGALYHQPLGVTSLSLSHPTHRLLSSPTHQFLFQEFVGNHKESLGEISVHNVHCSPLICWRGSFMREYYQVCRA